MSGSLAFVDTNVLLYAYDRTAGEKRARAAALLKKLWVTRSGALSTQVLQEFSVNSLRKLNSPLDRESVVRVVRRYAVWPVHRPEPLDIVAALARSQDHGLSFWDGLIVQAAVRLDARILYTEDLNPGQRFDGVEVVNPFDVAGNDPRE